MKPDDEIEYTISFLSAGNAAASDLLICDRIPANTTFIENAYGSTDPSGAEGDRGIMLSFNGVNTPLTNISDGDEISNSSAGVDDGIGGYYFSPGTDPTNVFPNINCGGANTNGVVVVDMSDVPNATGDGTPTNAYGFVRFRVAVD